MKIITLVENTCGREGCIAEHGLSLYIETEKHRLLLDAGQTDAVIIETAHEFAQMNTVIYSGHCTGIPAFELMKTVMGDKLRALHSGETAGIF